MSGPRATLNSLVSKNWEICISNMTFLQNVDLEIYIFVNNVVRSLVSTK